MRLAWRALAFALGHLVVYAAPQDGGQGVDYMVVVTGGELLAGEYPDGHTHFLTRTLRPMGLRCTGSMTVDDRKEAMDAALRFASERVPLMIVTGGLGPTDNDVTRETLEAFTGIALSEHQDVLAAMEQRLNTPRDQMRTNLRKQSRVPNQGTYLKNANGTAVGLVFEMKDRVIVALPGPPRELEPMVKNELVPYLTRRFGAHPPGCCLTVRFVGLGQSAIDQILDERIKMPPGVIPGSRFEGSRVDFTFSMPHDTAEERVQLETLRAEIERHLKDNIYATGEESLEEVLLKGLGARGLTLSIAEVGSGGALATGLNAAKGADVAIRGSFSAPHMEGLRRLLDIPEGRWAGEADVERRLRALAENLAARTSSGWAIVIGEIDSRDGAARTVPAALRFQDGRIEMLQAGLRGAGESARAGLVTQFLDMLRRRLL